MKRVRCPKCDGFITFDETRYEAGQQLVFVCPQCNKQFGIRIGKSVLRPQQRDEDPQPTGEFGSIIVIENVFHYKQVIPLRMGQNVIGRYVKGNDCVNTPIETVDPSVDTRHCIINVSYDRNNHLQYLLSDAPSETGTFVGNTLLRPGEHRPLSDGDVVTIGATTFILAESEA